MSLSEVHGRLATTAIMYVVAMGIWAIFRFVRRQEVDGGFRGGLIIGELLILVQAALGASLWLFGNRPLPGSIHLLYGIVAVLVIPGAILYSRGDEQPRAFLLYAAALLFLIGILIRGLTTGSGG